MLGIGDEQFVAAILTDWRTAPVPDRVRVTLGFLEKVTISPQEITAEDLAPLRAAGVSEKAIEEALYVCFLFNLMNRLADSFEFSLPSPAGFRQDGQLLFEHGYKSSSRW